MPIYEYECQSCQEVIEIWQSLSESPATSCPSCKGSLKKIISMSSFQLKGGGWFADGYSNSPATKSATGSATATKSTSTPAPACAKAKKPCDSC